MTTIDVAVIGAGRAGLAAGHAFAHLLRRHPPAHP
jgi:cation diffusion facilitator CzcD-associated flavoprotein CzcO